MPICFSPDSACCLVQLSLAASFQSVHRQQLALGAVAGTMAAAAAHLTSVALLALMLPQAYSGGASSSGSLSMRTVAACTLSFGVLRAAFVLVTSSTLPL